ncbi:LacI family DNA-binding transcriptional regulator [Paenibacillus sp. IB182496]|uniref:LacI family DNA-binding transcriptional regulator n=1 Tax=Paenibacillus sabuli TaxID=2772509 RepID=A0A927BUE7_9BACL|nr:LacI family DNA-binding transcriptional regulator [Paenibacillus sabuli]MBD2847016.1 LacI family DNA-binding transcriptional regulator [Paenibacillus sabuli]
MGRRKRATLADLSAELGISIQTISKALRGRPGMSEETRGRIMRTAYLRGYMSSAQARELVRQGIAPYPSYRLRFVLVQSHQSLTYNRLLTAGLQERLGQYEHRLDCYVLEENLSEVEFEEWAQTRNLTHADGLLIAPRLTSGSMEEQLLKYRVPKVLINYPRPLTQVDSVIWDVYEAVCMAVDRLARAGHRRLLYIGDIAAQRGYMHRWQAYQEMMAALGEPALRATADDFEAAFLRHRPTALLVGIDEDCDQITTALDRLGIRVPEDCSLVALRNAPPEEALPISRPQLMIREAGYEAADRILWRIAHPNAPHQHTRIRGGFHDGRTIAAPQRT